MKNKKRSGKGLLLGLVAFVLLVVGFIASVNKFSEVLSNMIKKGDDDLDDTKLI